jgi:PncC family amidohydrolase
MPRIKWSDVMLRNKSDGYSFDLVRPDDVLNESKIKAHIAGYSLLKKLMAIKLASKGNINHQIATAESLTGGLIFSILVDIPFAGSHKYGCFSVYDTDAKRTLLGVKVKELYSHKCVKEMAEGVLKNSNASIAIVVSGNAMTDQSNKDPENIKKLGEVFIGVAGYGDDKTILCDTKVFNFCSEKKSKAANICDYWITEALKPNNYNNSIITSLISNYIRNKTAEFAFNMAIKFINKNKLVTPLFLQTDRPMPQLLTNATNNIFLQSRSKLKTVCLNKTLCENESRDGNKMKKIFKHELSSSDSSSSSSPKRSQLTRTSEIKSLPEKIFKRNRSAPLIR